MEGAKKDDTNAMIHKRKNRIVEKYILKSILLEISRVVRNANIIHRKI
jgi:hypothetical protein